MRTQATTRRIVQESMFPDPVAPGLGTDAVFDKYPGSILVERGSGNAPGVVPGKVELDDSEVVGRTLGGQSYIADLDVVRHQ